MNRRAIILALVTLLTCALAAQTARQHPPSKAAAPAPGELSNGIYRNPSFGFTYKLPYGWVDRTPEMREASTDPAKEMVLLGVFERPPEATGEGVNSGVVIAAESAASYPGLKSAAQYFGPLAEITTAKGLTAVNEPYEFPVDAKPIVRGDFVKKVGNGSLHQSTLAWLAKGYVVSFTFIGDSDDEVLQLLDGLTFGNKPAPATRK
ncbi:MAG TPA: hypothetical protein VK763_17525 [Terriglobales bacterium]|jgi:hypothetical protein|nr:hypothetical protein [Terriglobales bacterium]